MEVEYNRFWHINQILPIDAYEINHVTGHVKYHFIQQPNAIEPSAKDKIQTAYLNKDASIGCVITEDEQGILEVAMTNFTWPDPKQMVIRRTPQGALDNLAFGELQDSRLWALRPDIRAQKLCA